MNRNKILLSAVAILGSLSLFSNANATTLLPAQTLTASQPSSYLTKVSDRYDRDYSYSRKSIDQVKWKLGKRGYKKIVVLDNQSPIYVLKACRDGVKYKFAIRDDGKIRYKKNIGYCKRKYKRYTDDYYAPRRQYRDDYGLSPRQIIRKLGQHGYGRVYFIDKHPPVYALNGCRGGIRYKVYVGRGGGIRKAQRIGYCSTGSRYIDYWKSPRRFR